MFLRFFKLFNYLGLKTQTFLLFCAVIFVNLGQNSFEKFLPAYLDILGGTAVSIGALGALQNAIGAIWSLPGGYLSDKLGYRNALITFTILAMIGYLIPLVMPGVLSIFIGMALFSTWPAMVFPAIISLFSSNLAPGKRAMGLSMHSIIRRIPMALGPIIGGMLIGTLGVSIGIKMAMIFAFLLGFLGLTFLWRIPVEPQDSYEPLRIKEIWQQMSPNLRHLLLSDIFVRFCEQIPNMFVVLWCLKIINISPAKFGFLIAIEMITAMLIYIPVAHFSDRLERKPFVLLTFAFFALFPAVLYFSRSFFVLVFAFIIKGLKEFGEPTRKALIADLANAKIRARTVGLYYLIRDLMAACGALSGGLLWNLSPGANLWAAFAFGVLGTIIYGMLGRSAATR